MSRITYFQDLLSSLFERRTSSSAKPDARGMLALCNSLLADTGEVTGLQTGSALLANYATLTSTPKPSPSAPASMQLHAAPKTSPACWRSPNRAGRNCCAA